MEIFPVAFCYNRHNKMVRYRSIFVKEVLFMTNVLVYLEQSAQMHPEKTAVLDPETRYTYAQLMQQSQRIGSALSAVGCIRKPVAVLMNKSSQALSALLGVVYAGGFYVFISPEQPVHRINQILEITSAVCLVTDQPEKVAEVTYSGVVLDYQTATAAEVDEAVLAAIRAQALDIDPLYCNFTSGSTGVPKGVVVCHRSVIDFISVFPELFGITERDVIGNQAPFDFDVSVKDIYSALKMGATLVVIPKKMFSVVTQLLDYLCDNHVTTLIWAVSALCLIVQFKGLTYKVPTSVNKILFSGEMMPVKYLHLWQSALPRATFVNLYGPTEITCNCTYYRVDRAFAPEEQLPIGRPFPNETVFLLDDNDQLVTEPGVSGELCVSGTALAMGYFNNPEQTHKAFVQNPLNKSYLELIYRTGDLAFYSANGELYFGGRKDFQIKYMGHRIELEEIETVLNSFSQVDRACCVFDTAKNRLIAFYCGTADPKELKKSLYDVLPEYMIPSLFRQMPELPLTPNGKINRKLLLETDGAHHG